MNEPFGFYYENGAESIHFHPDGEFRLTVTPDVSSIAVELSEAQTAGQIGTSITNQSIVGRDITFTGCILKNLAENRRKLLRVVAPGRHARMVYDDGARRLVLEGVPVQTPMIESGAVVQDFQFRFHAPYPYWRNEQPQSVDVAGLTPLFRFTFDTGGAWMVSEFSNHYYHQLYNDGNVPVEMEVQFYARSAVKNPELFHMGNRTRIALQKTMLAGESIVVSTVYGRRGVWYYPGAGAAAENGFRYLTVDSNLSMALDAGDNWLRFDAETNRQGMRCNVKAYMGVCSGV